MLQTLVSKPRLLCGLLALTVLVQSVSCGTILYPERIGQTGGPLDYKVVALNTVGMLLFVVPGVVAFAVDFYNGTIYLPSGTYRGQSPDQVAASEWQAIKLPANVKSREDLQSFLAEETGHSIALEQETLEIYELKNLPTEAPVSMAEKQEKSFFQKIEWSNWLTLGRQEKNAPDQSRTEAF